MTDEKDQNQLEAEVDNMMAVRTPGETREQVPSSAPELVGKSAETQQDEELPTTNKDDPEESTQLEAENSAESTAELTQPDDKNDKESADESTAKTKEVSLDDAKTAEAIDSINKSDSDAILESQDEKSSEDDAPKKPNIVRRWWDSRPWRYGTLIVILAILIAAVIVPTSRFWVLNQLGYRSNVTLTVFDGSSGLALKGATVTVAGQNKLSGKDGEVAFSGIKLGKHNISIVKSAFASVKKTFSVGLQTNDLGKITLKAVGIQYEIKLSDYISSKPVIGAEVTSDSASAQSDVNGKAILTTMDSSSKTRKLTIKANGYLSKTVKINSNEHRVKLPLVPIGQDYFISKESGKYDLYSSNFDGSNRKVLLAATGREGSDTQLSVNNSGNLLALVNTRDDKRAANGDILQTITIINAKTKLPLTLDHANNIQLVGWLDGGTLVYVVVTSCKDSSCYQLKSYNYDSSTSKELASASGFSSVLSIDNRIYYATTRDYQDKNSQPKLVAVNSDGTNKKVLLKQDIYSVYRPGYDQLLLASPGSWYSYKVGDQSAKKVAAPSNPSSVNYVDSPDGQGSAWIDQRDGQPVLLIHNKSSGKDKIVTSKVGLTYPIRWINNKTLIFRVDKASETADYIFSLVAGKPKKITNVENSRGADGLRY